MFKAGDRVHVIGMHDQDSFFRRRSEFIGKNGTITDNPDHWSFIPGKDGLKDYIGCDIKFDKPICGRRNLGLFAVKLAHIIREPRKKKE